MSTGRLFLIVGPSGAGKDSLLEAAKRAIEAENTSHVVFPRRYITRPADAGGEDHIEISEEAFEARAQEGFFALQWKAHGLRYGVSKDALTCLNQGTSAAINVSRSILDEIRQNFERVTVLSISVDPAVLEERLRARARESEEDIQDRLARSAAYHVHGADVVEIRNNGPLEESLATFMTALTGTP